jgi:hypothetical protein
MEFVCFVFVMAVGSVGMETGHEVGTLEIWVPFLGRTRNVVLVTASRLRNRVSSVGIVTVPANGKKFFIPI